MPRTIVTAKQLIRALEEKVAEHGDLPVMVSTSERDHRVESIEHGTWVAHRLVDDARAGAIIVVTE